MMPEKLPPPVPLTLLISTNATVTALLARTDATTYRVTFSEKMDVTTAETLTNYTLSGTCAASVGNPSGAVLQASGLVVILTTPDTSGCNSGGETVIVTPAATITDVAGVALTSSAATHTLGDAVAPLVLTYSPADNATDVAITANLVLTFNENVQVGAGNVLLYKTTGDVLVETINIAGVRVAFNGTTGVTIDPTANLLK
jgi:methionine-rich copper-binding protein CopC